jgi:hypothetical protein
LEAPLRWQLSGLIAPLAGDDPAWTSLVSAQPQSGALAGTALGWLDQVIAQVDLDLAQLPGQQASLQAVRTGLQEQYQKSQAASWSLSPNLTVKDIGPVQTQVVRPSGLMALIGGLAGLLVWVVVELVRINRKDLPRA